MELTFYGIQAPLRCLYPKPLAVAEVLRLMRLSYSADGEAVPNMRLVDRRTLEEVTGHILEADEPHIICCEGGDDLPQLLDQLRSANNADVRARDRAEGP
jgi:hypothetical protein